VDDIIASTNGSLPDLVLHPDIHRSYLPEGIEKLDCPTACFQIDAYSSSENRASVSRLFDLPLIFHPSCIPNYSAFGHSGVRSFPHAIPAEKYTSLADRKQYDVSSIGRLDGPDYTYRRSSVDRLKNLDVKTNDMERYYPYDEMIKTYAQSRITVNVGRGNHLGKAHLSCLEIMGAGTLLLTTRSSDTGRPHELETLGYTEDEHFATFANLDELERKIRYYLAHDEERITKANRARKHTLRKHTCNKRAETLLRWIEDGIPRQAPAREMDEDQVASIYVDYFSKRGHVDETLYHLRRQRKANGSGGRLLSSVGKAAKATVRGWQRALTS
jgi:spore maturation protein CgeB